MSFVVVECDERGIPAETVGPFASYELALHYATEAAERSQKEAFPSIAPRFANQDGSGDDWWEVRSPDGTAIEYWHIQAVRQP